MINLCAEVKPMWPLLVVAPAGGICDQWEQEWNKWVKNGAVLIVNTSALPHLYKLNERPHAGVMCLIRYASFVDEDVYVMQIPSVFCLLLCLFVCHCTHVCHCVDIVVCIFINDCAKT